MGYLELLLVAVGLSMDAFAASLSEGLKTKKSRIRKNCLTVALFFGFFQAMMPLIGWILGKQFASYIVSVDHWIAFGLLTFIGGKMIAEALKDDVCSPHRGKSARFAELLMLAIATSIDALAVGVTFAFLQVSILPAVLLIGATTFTISYVGVAIGYQFGSRYKQKAELAGGIVLILIGLKILLEHLALF